MKCLIMRTKKLWIVFVAFAVLILSCTKDEEPCEAIIENSGIIVASVNISSCEQPFYQGSFVIRTNAEYDELLSTNNPCDRPFIDFSSLSLLGRYAYTANTGSYFRNVEIDTAHSRYVYTITVENCGSCNCLSENMNWVTVPKLPEEWTVKFVVE